MKKNIVFILALFLLGTSLNAQINTGIVPKSFKETASLKKMQHIQLEPISQERIYLDELESEKNGTMMKAARLIPVELNVDNAGTWSVLSDRTPVWRLQISSEGAKYNVIHFKSFRIPEGGRFFVYAPDRSMIFGPYTHKDNPDGEEFAIGLLRGSSAVLEYEAPVNKSLDGSLHTVKPQLEISEFSYVYRGAEEYENHTKAYAFGESDECEVNANCSEGDNWRTEQRGIAHIYVRDGYLAGYCSGNLVNNTANDKTSYLLTADHCGGDASASDMKQWIFTFFYESEGCKPTEQPQNYVALVGATRMARAGGDGTSDFLLLKLDATAEDMQEMRPIYNGWSIDPEASTSGFCFHHPAGDVKKISTYTQTLNSGTYRDAEMTGATNAFWIVRWAKTANGHGVTEGGSSGSSLFNSEGLVVGTLTGGASYCTNTSGTDSYGKLSYHWESNGSEASQQLKPWLDPVGTNQTTCPRLGDANCVANFTADRNVVYVGETVTFRDVSYASTDVISREWKFPGGNPEVSSGEEVAVRYEKPGKYAVKLKVVTEDGSDSISRQDYMEVLEYYRNFTYDFESCEDFAVDKFSPCTTRDVDGCNTYGLQDVSFPNSGYIGSFIAFNPKKTTPAMSFEPHSGERVGWCMAAIGGANDDWFITPFIVVNDSTEFSAWVRSYTSSYGFEKYQIYVIKKNGEEICISGESAVSAPVSWTEVKYDLGKYKGDTLKVAVRCVSNDAMAFLIDDIYVGDGSEKEEALVADFEALPLQIQVGQSVSFTNKSTAVAESFKWEFEGGSPATSTEKNPKVVYAKPGKFDVKLVAMAGQNSDEKWKIDYIEVVDTPHVVSPVIEIEGTDHYENEPVLFKNATKGDYIGQTWTFGSNATPKTSTDKEVSVIFNKPGKYTVKLAVRTETATYQTTEEVVIKKQTSNEELETSGVRVHPNPTQGKFYLDLPQRAEVSVHNLLGQKLMERTLNPGENEMDLTRFGRGSYILHIVLADQTYRTIKVVVE